MLRKSVKPEHFSEESIRVPEVNALISKTEQAELTGMKSPSATVQVRMKGGRAFSEFTNTPKGDPVTNLMSKHEIMAKYRSDVDFSKTISRESGEKLLALLDPLEELDRVNRIVELLAA